MNSPAADKDGEPADEDAEPADEDAEPADEDAEPADEDAELPKKRGGVKPSKKRVPNVNSAGARSGLRSAAAPPADDPASGCIPFLGTALPRPRKRKVYHWP